MKIRIHPAHFVFRHEFLLCHLSRHQIQGAMVIRMRYRILHLALHALVAAGYETVLAGRMHFVGEDQRHGFTKRIAPDITPVSWTVPKEKMAQERGNLMGCQGEPFCLNYVGAGESPVMNYDKMVIEQVLEYLEEPHEKPQFILVGTYECTFSIYYVKRDVSQILRPCRKTIFL